MKKLESEENLDDCSAGMYLRDAGQLQYFKPDSMRYFIEVIAHMTKPLRGINRMLNNASVFSVTG